MQYYRPEPTDQYIGAPIPFWHGGVLHVYYLTACRGEAIRSGTGCQEWGHLSSADLQTWTHHPPAMRLKAEEGTAQKGLLGGSIVTDNGRFYAALALHLEHNPTQISEHICIAVSDDCLNFVPSATHRSIDPPEGHSRRHFRDPCLFRDGQGLFHLLVGTELLGERPLFARGCLAHFGSLDLRSWKREEPFLLTGIPSVPENPDYFVWNDWHYITFQHCGQLFYRMSRQPEGPWQAPLVDTLDGLSLAAMKTVPFRDGRRLAVGYLRWRDHDHDNGIRRYGGNLVFRELIQAADGSLGTRFVADMVPPATEPQRLSVWSLAGDVDVIRNDMQFLTPESAGIVRFSKACREGRIMCRIEPNGPAKAFGLCVRGGGLMQRGYEIRFCPHERLVSVRNLERDMTVVDNRLDTALYGVDCLDKPFDLDVIMKDDIIDLCVNQERTLISRFPDWKEGELYLFCLNGEVMFRNVQVMPLAGTKLGPPAPLK